MSDAHGAPLAPTLTAHLFPRLGDELVRLLRSLDAAAWEQPTVCTGWAVRDVAAHLLDTALRRLSFGRDRHPLPRPERPVTGYGELVSLIDRLNAEWVVAARRLSPELLTGLIEWVEPRLAAHLASLDPSVEAELGVAWAGEERSPVWFDVARELTERWHHQGQIRLATGAPPLVASELSEPVFDTFLRALPHRYAAVAAPEGAVVRVTIRGEASYAYSLRREAGAWRLLKRATEAGRLGEATAPARPAAEIELDEGPAWLLLTKGLAGPRARAAARVEGEERLAAPFFGTLAVMA